MNYSFTKIAVVGDNDTCLAFKAIGADTYAAGLDSANKVLKDAASKDYGMIFIAEELAVGVADMLQALKMRLYPAIVVVPSATGTGAGFATELLKKDIERAIGSDAVFGKQ